MGALESKGNNPEARSSLVGQAEVLLSQAKYALDKSDRYYHKNAENYDRLVKWFAFEKNRGRLIDKASGTYIG